MNRLRVCFEIDGIATDENGNPCPAGLQIDLGESEKYIAYEELADSINIPAALSFVGLDRDNLSAVRVITPE